MSPKAILRYPEHFADKMASLPPEVRAQVDDILQSLWEDPWFVPDEVDYLVDRRPENTFLCTAKHGGWHLIALLWHVEAAATGDEPATVDVDILVGAVQVDEDGHIWVYAAEAPPEPEPEETQPAEDVPVGAAPEAEPAPAPPPMAAPPPLDVPVISLPSASVGDSHIIAPHAKKPQPSNVSLVPVYYATDREELVEDGQPAYGPGRSANGELHYGECVISIPKTHKKGELESPKWWKLEFSPDPEKHIVLDSIASMEEQVFLQTVAFAVASSASKEAFIFVHGYNVKFEDAARRAGQLAFDLEFAGAPLLYSWPANGKTADYFKDEADVAWSEPHFKRFLNLLAAHVGATKIHIIAHSMGNRVVCNVLKELGLQAGGAAVEPVALHHVVLAAPDIDADTFKELAATLEKSSRHVTLYQSAKDKALLASKQIHGNPRAGEPVLVIPGLDTIDASAVDTDFLGHSYFSDSYTLLSDIHSLLAKNEPVDHRFGLESRATADGTYYAFRT